MRNLKRALSLTLASVMLLGMMVVGSSAAQGYSDVAEDDNVEAIEVLQAIEVMVGDERGFGPERPVNRAEMAVVMALLLNLDYDYYVTSCPFSDVYDWARGPVGACYANKIVSGRGDGIYDPGATVTAVEAASMLMRALGYFQYQNDYADGFELATVRQGSKINLFDGVGSSSTEPMTRNQVAQMVLNALQTGIVEPDGQTINLTTPDGQVYTGKVNYVNVTSKKDFAYAISDVQATSVGSVNDGAIVELGEQLYNGNLELDDDARDAFGRPSRDWKFRGNEIGTYIKKELIRKEWTVEVTGKDLYDEITKATLDDKKYDKNLFIDGQDDSKFNDQLFALTSTDLRNNKNGVGATGNGVLTQLFIDPKAGNDYEQKDVTVAIINTYLARAKADYSEKKDEVDFNVYGLEKVKGYEEYRKVVDTRDDNKDTKETLTITSDDFDIDGIKKDDTFLVTVADGEIQTMADPEVLSAATMTAFKKNDNVVVNGTQYDYATTAEWDWEVLDKYTGQSGRENLKDKSYDVYLDKYGYAIGVDLVDKADNYIFITGIDADLSNRYATNIDASGIFLDGTMKEITYNSKDSSDLTTNIPAGKEEFGLVNTWCTYTVNKDGIYTLKKVASKIDIKNGKDIAQSWDTSIAGEKIDRKNISMDGDTSGTYSRVYGNDNTVYLNAVVETINVDKPANTRWRGVISDVDSVITGIDNVSLDVYKEGIDPSDKGKPTADYEGSAANVADENGDFNAHKCTKVAYGAYALYDDDGYIIAAVTVADDGSTSDNWVYVTSGSVTREVYDSEKDEWTWYREVALNGEKTEISYKGDSIKYLDDMAKYNWYEVKYKGDGNVKSVGLAVDKLPHSANGVVASAAASTDKYEGNIKHLDKTVKDGKDVILYEASNYEGETPTTISSVLAGNGYTAFTDQKGTPYLDGKTFFVTTTTKTGFRVMEDVKVVFIQTNDNKEKIYWEDGIDKLEELVDSLNPAKDGKYDYEVSAVLDSNRATVVVIRDLNEKDGTSIGGGSTGSKPSGSEGIDVNVIALLDEDGDDVACDDPGKVSFIATTGKNGTVSRTEKCEAVKDAYVEKFSDATDSNTEVRWEADPVSSTYAYRVYVDDVFVDAYEEGTTTKLPSVPTPAEAYKQEYPNGPTTDYQKTEVDLMNSDWPSWDAVFTPSVVGGRITITVSNIDWHTDLDVKVPYFFYDSASSSPANDLTIRQAYLTVVSGDTESPAKKAGSLTTDLVGKDIVAFAIIPIVKANGGARENIIFMDSAGDVYWQNGTKTTSGKITLNNAAYGGDVDYIFLAD